MLTRTINLRRRLVKISRVRRLHKAMDYLKEDIAKHAKVDASLVKISGDLNSYVTSKMARGMNSVKVTVDKVGDVIKVDLATELKRAKKEEKPVVAAPAAGKPKDEEKASAAAASVPAPKEKKAATAHKKEAGVDSTKQKAKKAPG